MGDSSLFSSSSSASSFLGSSDAKSGLPDSTLFFCELVSSTDAADLRRRRHRFLDACCLCKRPIGCVSDVFMYRGDAPFCSEECRQEQMEMDEALQRCCELPSSSSTEPMMSRRTSLISIPMKPHNIHCPVGATTVAG